MINLNFSTVEELIFQNEEVQKILPPEFNNYFESWKLGKRLPMLRQLSKTALLDFLNHLQDNHIQELEKYFEDRIILERLSYDIVRNLKIPLSESAICKDLCDIIGFKYFTIWRDDQHLYLSLWR